MGACSKKLPSSPAPAAGTPVIVNVQDKTGISRNIRITGTVKNQSGITIYDVRIALEVYRDDPVFANFIDTSAIKIPVLPHDSTLSFGSHSTFGDVFINVFPVYEIIPP